VIDQVLDNDISEVQGDVVVMVLKDGDVWRMIHQEMIGAETPRTLHLYDNFKGIAECDHLYDSGMCPAAGTGKVDYDGFMSALDKLVARENVKVHKVEYSNIEDSEMPSSIAFAIIDAELYQTTKDQLKAVRKRMAKGGVIMIHNFGFEGYPGVERAVNDFNFENKDSRMLTVSLPGSEEGVACYIGMIQF